MIETIELLGVPIHSLTLDDAAVQIVQAAKAGAGGWVVTPNLDILRRASHDPAFRRMYDATTLRLADGMPLIWASRLRGTPLPERAAGSDLIYRLAARAAEAGVSLYLIGGNPGTADKTSARLRELHPALVIAGTECPPPGFEREDALVQSMAQRVGESGAGIVLVALGCPKQEMLIERVRHRLPHAWFIGVGITFSFVAGEVHRAPVWMQRTGIEWVHRLVQEPRRLARRYLVNGLPFAVRLLVTSTFQGLARKSGKTQPRRVR